MHRVMETTSFKRKSPYGPQQHVKEYIDTPNNQIYPLPQPDYQLNFYSAIGYSQYKKNNKYIAWYIHSLYNPASAQCYLPQIIFL